MLNTIVSQRRLHIANDANYQGSVNSYNNWATKSFSKLFKFSTNITINNEKRCVNNKSYLKLLPQLGVNVPEDASAKEYKNFDGLTCSYLKNRGLMRQHISTKKSDKLGKAFIHAIVAGNMQKATDLIGKGANIDQHFWLRESYGLTFNNDPAYGLPAHNLSLGLMQYTPLIYAALQKEFKNTDDRLLNLLEHYQANQKLTGASWAFERKITNVSNHVSVQNSYYGNGTIGADVVNTTIIHGQDEYRKGTQLSYNQATKSVNLKTLTDQNHGWSKSSDNTIVSVQPVYLGRRYPGERSFFS